MEIFTMECFINAVDLRSLSKAAGKMHITQPALSMQIKKLETELNVKLINRSSHSFSLTDDGRAVYQSFSAIVGTYNNLRWQLEQGRHNRKVLRVGYHGPTFWANLPDLFYSFMLDHPNIQIDATVSELCKLKEMVSRGDVDVAILISPGTPAFDREEMISVELFKELGCFGMSPDHPFASKEIIHAEDLERQRIYMNADGEILGNTKPFADAGIASADIHFANGYIATIVNALAKDSLVIMPRTFKWEHDGIVYVDHDIEKLAVNYYAICRKENLTREVSLFLKACRSFAWPGTKP